MKNFVDYANAKGFLHESETEIQTKKNVYDLFVNAPLPSDEILSNLTLFLNPKTLGRILFFNHMYEKILNSPGVIMEFGVQYGGVYHY